MVNTILEADWYCVSNGNKWWILGGKTIIADGIRIFQLSVM